MPRDLCISDWGIRETLSFAGEFYYCQFPYDSIFAISDDTPRISTFYPDSMPNGMAATILKKDNKLIFVNFGLLTEDGRGKRGLRLVK